MSPFSQRAYQYATELKVDSLELMERAESPFEDNEKEIEKLSTELQKAFEFAKGRPNNEHSTRQWELLLSPGESLLGGFLARWESEGSLSYPFISESRKIVSDAFDSVIGLESGKLHFDK